MTWFKRLFSSDFRAAVAAEAAGDLELAAERYALAGDREAAVRMHLERASRADARDETIDALRDALHWASPDMAACRVARGRLGRALLARARDQGVATERDRERVREAASLLVSAGDCARAGEALLEIGEHAEAARAFERGGLVDRMEQALALETARGERERQLTSAFADYEARLASGERDAAAAALRRCVELAEDKADYRRLLDDLESRIIGGARVALRRRTGERRPVAILVGARRFTLGRDPLCELPLRSAGISRAHAEIAVDTASARFALRDLGSRNGTKIGNMPIASAVPLADQGEFGLGDECAIRFRVDGDPALLTLAIEGGLDRDLTLRAGAPGDPLPLADLLAIDAAIRFRDGRPWLSVNGSAWFLLNGSRIAVGAVQLIRGDQLGIDGVEVEVE